MKRIILSILFAGALFGACSPLLEEVSEATLPSGKVRIVVQTDVLAFQRPATRVAHESALGGDLWVLVFKGTDDNATFEEAVKAADGSDGSRSVVLNRQSLPVRVLVLANAPAITYQNGVPIWPNNAFELTPLTTYADAIDGLITPDLSSPLQPSNPYDQEPLPMSVSLSLSEIGLSTALGTAADPLRLKRVVAKIAVRKEFADPLSTFTLRGATVCSAPRNGTLFPRPVPKSNLGNQCDYQALDPDPIVGIAPATAVQVDGVDYPQGVSTEGNPIYVYESPATERPFVLVQGRYSNDTQDSYYKLLLPDGDVERNKYYRLRIKSVSTSGYSTPDEAKSAPANNSIRFDIDVIDLSSYDLTDNGNYFLGVSNSEWINYGNNLSERSISIAELSHNAPLGVKTASATASAGVVPLSPFDHSDLFDGTLRSAIPLTTTLPMGFNSSVVTIRLGNLSKSILLARHPAGAIPTTGSRIDDFLGTIYKGAYLVDAGTTDWIRFSFSPTLSSSSTGLVVVNSYDGGFYVHVFPNVGSRRAADLYIVRSGEGGRLKVHIEQQGVGD